MADQNTSEKDILDPSSFRLPEDFEENPDDYELWSVRAPIKLDMSALNDVALQFNLKNRKKAGVDPVIATVAIHGETYGLAEGHKKEVASLRILKEESDEEDGKGMVPMPIEFQRHFTFVESSRANIADIDLAPSCERAPEVDTEKTKMRVPYTPIAQRSGLKRRWNMMGSNAKYTAPPQKIEKKTKSSVIESTKKESKKKSKSKSKSKSSEKKKQKKSSQ